MAKKIQKGKALEELVKGSMDYTMQLIRDAFRVQFRSSDGNMGFYVNEIFADHVIVSAWGSSNELKTDEFWKVTYSKSDASSVPSGSAQREYTFAARDQWEVVELAYQPQTVESEQSTVNSDQSAVGEAKGQKGKGAKGHRIEERIDPMQVKLLEARDETKGTRRLRINDLMVADVVNGNKRLYSKDVIEAMVADWQPHLRESRGQGRLMILSGEVEHPSDKGQKPQFLETVVRWDTLDWNGKSLSIEGDLILTSKGKDVEILMEAGVNPGGSIRGMGESKIEKVKGEKVEVVQWAVLNAADLVGDPSFVNAAEIHESINQGDDEMFEELKKLLAEHPELFPKGMTEAQLEALGEKQLRSMEEKVRAALGIGADANIVESLKATAEKAKKFDESQARAGIDAAINEATKDLPFGEKLNKIFVEAFKGMEFTDAKAVTAFAENQRKQFSQLAAAGVLKDMGFDEKTSSVKVLGSVLERETGIPEFGRASFEIIESVRKHENRAKRAMELRAESPAAVFTDNLLKRFDTLYQHKLIAEARMFEEAEAASDLNLPYSVSRAIIAEAYPNLVAANVFDIGIMEQTPMNLYYEAFSGETGYSVDITDEVVTGGAEGTWYSLAHPNVVPGTVVVTSNPAGTSYVEGTDYIIDYMLGKVLFLVAGSIGANDILIDYTYHATRQGEGVAIERAKTTLSYQTITAAAMRLADDINTEAIVFSRSQLGWDAVGRTMANLIKELRRDIDRALIEKAVMAALSVASNSTAAWDVSDAVYATLVSLIGQAKVKVMKRFYEPTAVLMSVTNADYLSNWDGFKRDGFPNALLNAAGFAGSVKGLPVFNSTEMRDTWNLVLNRELVLHRVYQPMTVKGPFPKYSSDKLIAAEQYYAEEFNASLAPIGGKGSLVPTQA